MRRALIAVLIVMGCCSCVWSAGAGNVLYVSPAGDDGWSGAMAECRGDDGPLQTLAAARDRLRELRAAGTIRGSATVVLRGGQYLLSEPLTLGAEDSYTRWIAHDGETPVLSAGIAVDEWKPWRGEIVVAQVALDEVTDVYFRGRRQMLARYPNFDADDPYKGGYIYVDTPDEENPKRWLHYHEGDLPEWADIAGAQVWAFSGPNYWNNVIDIARIDREKRIIELEKDASYVLRKWNRYFVRNLLAELDAPGEWYFDGANGLLYFWPPDDIEPGNVTVPVASTVIEIVRGNGAAPAGIIVRGLTLQSCAGTGVVMTDSRGCRVEKCTVRGTGATGVSLSGGTNNGVIGCNVYDTGESGITLNGGNRATLHGARNYADNNWVHHTGYYSKASSGIGIYGVENMVSHNLVHDTPRIGISFGGNDHIVEYNEVHHVNQETQDSGCIYSCTRDWTQRGTQIRYNFVHDSGGLLQGETYREYGYTWGVYLDDWSSGVRVYGNIAARCALEPYYTHSGRDNVFENNIAIDGYNGQMRFQPWATTHAMLPGLYQQIQDAGALYQARYPELSSIKDARADATMSHNTFVRNIIMYESDAPLYRLWGDFDYETNVLDENIVWHHGRPVNVGIADVALEDQWAAWQKKGMDVHSVIADPLFVDAAADDYRLREDSPALQMGFKPIPVDKIGPYEDEARASWPVGQDLL